MNRLRTILIRFRALFQKRKLDAEMAEEMRSHIELRTQQNIDCGMNVEEARFAAQRQFGWVESIKEACRDERPMGWIENFIRNVRFGARMLWKNPAFTAVAVLTLALGIGATSAVFTLIQGVLLTPPLYPKPEQVMLISMARKDGRACDRNCTAQQWVGWRDESKLFRSIAGYQWAFDFLILSDGSESLQGLRVTQDYFKVIGVNPALGRVFLESDAPAKPWDESLIIIGHDLWRRRFNCDPNIIGKTVRLGHNPAGLTIIGVMPPGIRFLPTRNNHNDPNYDVNARVEYWLPAATRPTERKWAMWNVVARLNDGAQLSQAQLELSSICSRQAEAEPDFEGIAAIAQPLTTELNREGRRLLLPLLGAVILVFLIACANVSGLFLARGIQRSQEYVLRCALGAGRGQLFRQVLTESALLAVLGAAVGVGIGAGVIKIIEIMAGSAIPRFDAVTFGWPVLTFSLGSAVLAASFASLAPALRASQTDPARGLKWAGSHTSSSWADRRLLGGVVILQTALTFALLVGAGLLIRTGHNLATVQPGYETQNILTASVAAVQGNWYDFHTRALARVAALPGVKSAAFVLGLPLTGNKMNTEVTFLEQPDTGKFKETHILPSRSVTSDYFETMGLKIIAGRGFRSTDAGNAPPQASVPGHAPVVAIINQAMAERYFRNSDPVGKHISVPNVGLEDQTVEIVGVLANTRSDTLLQEAGPELYFSLWQVVANLKHLVVRTTSDPRQLIASVQHELRSIDPTVVIEHVKTFEQIRRESFASQTFAMWLLVGSSLVASALALVGIYGVISLSIGSRRREIAIRMAVGSQRLCIVRSVIVQGMKLIAVGLVLGLSIALTLGRILKSFLFEVESTNLVTFLGMALLFACVAFFVCWLPAARASRLDPIEALRSE